MQRLHRLAKKIHTPYPGAFIVLRLAKCPASTGSECFHLRRALPWIRPQNPPVHKIGRRLSQPSAMLLVRLGRGFGVCSTGGGLVSDHALPYHVRYSCELNRQTSSAGRGILCKEELAMTRFIARQLAWIRDLIVTPPVVVGPGI